MIDLADSRSIPSGGNAIYRNISFRLRLSAGMEKQQRKYTSDELKSTTLAPGGVVAGRNFGSHFQWGSGSGFSASPPRPMQFTPQCDAFSGLQHHLEAQRNPHLSREWGGCPETSHAYDTFWHIFYMINYLLTLLHQTFLPKDVKTPK